MATKKSGNGNGGTGAATEATLQLLVQEVQAIRRDMNARMDSLIFLFGGKYREIEQRLEGLEKKAGR